MCITQDNVNLGLIPLSQALSMAQEQGLDLVQVSAPSKDRAPTCKILDSGKYKYELSKKKKEADKRQRDAIVKTKEIKFRPTTDLNDLKTKARKAEEFIEEGCRVKISITFKGREMSHQEVGLSTLETFMSFLPDLKMVGKPSFDKRDLTVFLSKREAANSIKEAS